jgi:hypothetical protein
MTTLETFVSVAVPIVIIIGVIRLVTRRGDVVVGNDSTTGSSTAGERPSDDVI